MKLHKKLLIYPIAITSLFLSETEAYSQFGGVGGSNGFGVGFIGGSSRRGGKDCSKKHFNYDAELRDISLLSLSKCLKLI